MIARTINGLDPFVCISAMQKCIRRGLERQAMEFACELIHSSKAFCSMAANRIELISHEDIDALSQPHIVPFVRAACEQAKEWWNTEKPGKARLPLGNAIMIMCRARKSRQADHFSGAVGLPSQIGGYVPEVPDWAYDHHTGIGLKKGRGLAFFRKESTKLNPPQENKDEYEEEFYKWQEKRFSDKQD